MLEVISKPVTLNSGFQVKVLSGCSTLLEGNFFTIYRLSPLRTFAEKIFSALFCLIFRSNLESEAIKVLSFRRPPFKKKWTLICNPQTRYSSSRISSPGFGWDLLFLLWNVAWMPPFDFMLSTHFWNLEIWESLHHMVLIRC